MVSEEYFKKLEAKCAKYYYLYQPYAIRDFVALAREIAKYTSNEGTISRIVNSLKRIGVFNIEGLMEADIDEIAKVRNIGHESLNIIRTIKGLPTLTYAQAHPFAAKTYRVYFCKPLIYGGTDEYSKDFNTLKQLSEFFKSSEYDGAVITHIVEEND